MFAESMHPSSVDRADMLALLEQAGLGGSHVHDLIAALPARHVVVDRAGLREALRLARASRGLVWDHPIRVRLEFAVPTVLDNLREEWTDVARTLQRQIDLIEAGSLNTTLLEHQRAPMLKRLRDAVYELAELQRAFPAQ